MMMILAKITLLLSFLVSFCLQYQYLLFKGWKMSNPGKGGMDFFKKFSDKGGMFAGFKIKGPKETKNVAQTETNLGSIEKPNEQQKPNQPLSRDDLAVRQQTREVEQPVSGEIKTEDSSIKKMKSKPAEVAVPAKKGEKVESDAKKIQEVSKEFREVKQEKKIEVVQAKIIIQSSEKVQIVQEKKSEKSSPTSAISQRKKSQKVAPTKKSEQSVARKPSMNIKQQKPSKKQEEKPKKSGKDQVLDQINEYNIKLAQSVITQKNTQARICEIRESISELRDKISHWTSQQSLCAQREEYEEAERLQNRIEQAQNKVDELSIEITFAEDQLLKQQTEQINILKSQNANLNKIGRRLKLIELELQNDAAVIKRQDVQKIQTLKNKQEIEKKKIQRIERDITYQSQQITEFQRLVKQELQSKLNPLNKEKAKLEGQKADLQSEIKELERKLKQKRAQLTDTNKQLKSVNDSIIQTNESFKEENTKLQQRKNNLQIIENQYDNLKLELENLEHTIEDQSKAMNAKVEKKLGQAIQIASLAKNIEQKQVTFEDELENRRVAFDNFTQNGKLLKQFEEIHRSQKDKIKEIEYKKSNITAEISKLQQKRDTIRKKIPIIEVQQKKFADLKNFKAAGLKKSEIKQLNDELALVKQKIQAALIEQHALGIEEQKMKSSQKENIQEEQSLQRNLAISQYRYGCLKVEKINEYREAIIRNSSSNIKDKDKLIKELTEVINKKNQELNYLRDTYQLHEDKPNGNDESEDIVEAEDDAYIEEGSNEPKELADNNNQEEIDNVADSNEEERIEEQAQSGYVPLELPCGGQEDDQQGN